MQPPCLAKQIAKHKVFEDRVGRGRWLSSRMVLVVDSCRLRFGRIVKVQRAEVGNFKLDGNAAMAAILLQYVVDEGKIRGKVARQGSQPGLRQFALQVF